MTSNDSFIDQWKSMLDEGGPRQRLIEPHPLKLYFGCNAANKPILFLTTTTRPDIPLFSSVVSVERGIRHDGNWTVVLTLQDKAFASPFMGMCSELIRLSENFDTADEALEAFYSTLGQWRTMLASHKPRGLSNDEVRGLIAELWFGLHRLSTLMSPNELVTSWQGPFGAAQDFRLPSGMLYEIKSVHTQSPYVEVSSPEQLDPVSEAKLRLVLVPIEEIELSQSEAAFTLLDIIKEFQEHLGNDQGAKDGFNLRLETLGVDQLGDTYEDRAFVVNTPKIFDIGEDFPRVLRRDVPPAVVQLQYKIKISSFRDSALEEPFDYLN